MKRALLVFSPLSALHSKGQDATLTMSGMNIQTYPATDTVPCLFHEVLNMDSAIMKWQSGYVIRKDGRISFNKSGNKTFVSPEYLPITSGIVESILLYNDKRRVTNNAIQVILKP